MSHVPDKDDEMAVTRERFLTGLTYEQYKSQMTRNQDRFQANERALVLTPEQLAPFRALPKPVDVLVLAEDWCGDVIANLPILGRVVVRRSGHAFNHAFLRKLFAERRSWETRTFPAASGGPAARPNSLAL